MKRNGFTLLEMILVLAVLTGVTAIGVPVYQRYQTLTDLRVGMTIAEQSLHRARALSQSGNGDSIWGVAIRSNQIVTFKGADYASRDATYDEVHEVPTNITLAGLTDITFAKMSGLPSTTGSITLSVANATKTITINNESAITIQ